MKLTEISQGMDGFCEHGNGASGSLENRNFLDGTRNHQLFRALATSSFNYRDRAGSK
jgi:hypothetical protein